MKKLIQFVKLKNECNLAEISSAIRSSDLTFNITDELIMKALNSAKKDQFIMEVKTADDVIRYKYISVVLDDESESEDEVEEILVPMRKTVADVEI